MRTKSNGGAKQALLLASAMDGRFTSPLEKSITRLSTRYSAQNLGLDAHNCRRTWVGKSKRGNEVCGAVVEFVFKLIPFNSLHGAKPQRCWPSGYAQQDRWRSKSCSVFISYQNLAYDIEWFCGTPISSTLSHCRKCSIGWQFSRLMLPESTKVAREPTYIQDRSIACGNY